MSRSLTSSLFLQLNKPTSCSLFSWGHTPVTFYHSCEQLAGSSIWLESGSMLDAGLQHEMLLLVFLQIHLSPGAKSCAAPDALPLCGSSPETLLLSYHSILDFSVFLHQCGALRLPIWNLSHSLHVAFLIHYYFILI